MSNKLNKAGFTLVEILVATAIIVTIVSMVYGSYLATLKTTEAYNVHINISQKAQAVLNRMARQIRCSYIPEFQESATEPTDLRGEDFRLPIADFQLKKTNRKSQIENRKHFFYGDSDNSSGEILHFVTTNSGQKSTDGLFETIYKFDKINRTLLISQKRFINAPKNKAEKKDWKIMLENITDIELTFFDGQQWVRSWDFVKEKNLPKAVRINITCEDENQRKIQYGTIADIYCWKIKRKNVEEKSSSNNKQ
jgi:prepilin-type N-terminal cleavage/methylation domain-containing protein